jgi:hypothetical protein
LDLGAAQSGNRPQLIQNVVGKWSAAVVERAHFDANAGRDRRERKGVDVRRCQRAAKANGKRRQTARVDRNIGQLRNLDCFQRVVVVQYRVEHNARIDCADLTHLADGTPVS